MSLHDKIKAFNAAANINNVKDRKEQAKLKADAQKVLNAAGTLADTSNDETLAREMQDHLYFERKADVEGKPGGKNVLIDKALQKEMHNHGFEYQPVRMPAQNPPAPSEVQIALGLTDKEFAQLMKEQTEALDRDNHHSAIEDEKAVEEAINFEILQQEQMRLAQEDAATQALIAQFLQENDQAIAQQRAEEEATQQMLLAEQEQMRLAQEKAEEENELRIAEAERKAYYEARNKENLPEEAIQQELIRRAVEVEQLLRNNAEIEQLLHENAKLEAVPHPVVEVEQPAALIVNAFNAVPVKTWAEMTEQERINKFTNANPEEQRAIWTESMKPADRRKHDFAQNKKF